MTSSAFGDWLLRKLVVADMTQAELARRSGISTAQISRLISGLSAPGIDSLNAIATALRLDPATVYAEAGVIPTVTDRDAAIEELNRRLARLSPSQREVLVSSFLDIIELVYAHPPTRYVAHDAPGHGADRERGGP